MSEFVKKVVDGYFNPTQQMHNSIKKANKDAAKYEKEAESRHIFLLNLVGKSLYKKCINHGALDTFAPIPLSALKLNIDDFKKLEKLNVQSDTPNWYAFISKFVSLYPRNVFQIHHNEVYTDIVFSTFDDVIDFFQKLVKSFKAAYKIQSDDIDVSPISKKLNAYLK